MSIYVIGDLHLSFNQNKPMDIFGKEWENHPDRIKENWIKNVKEEDLVVLAGDFSWAMYLEETFDDFNFISNLPGKKLLLKGNHDYWWTTVTSMKKFLKDNNFNNIDFLFNNSFLYDNKILVGTRGWAITDSENSEKMLKRESARLELSIKDGINKYGEDKEIICFTHYPPLIDTNIESMYQNKIINILKKYNIKKCYYAHLHGTSHKDAIEGVYGGINFKLISGDYLGFDLFKI
ncbi:MAG: metallophosphoesterase [Clostridia bacterium]|nr:metallophosphoesterase [Clostridia bacterium]